MPEAANSFDETNREQLQKNSCSGISGKQDRIIFVTEKLDVKCRLDKWAQGPECKAPGPGAVNHAPATPIHTEA